VWVIQRKLVFIAHPKMASRAVRDTIRHLGAVQVGSHHAIEPTRLEQEKKRGASVGCIIRNPYDVMVSWYFHMEVRKRTEVMEFEPWLMDILPKGNGYIEHGLFPGVPFCDTVMRFETLNRDWREWSGKCRIAFRPLEMVGPSIKRDHKHYSHFYNDATREAVATKFHEEICYGGYTFEEDPCIDSQKTEASS